MTLRSSRRHSRKKEASLNPDRTIGGAVVNVTSTATNLEAWFENQDVRWALQRPDFHLFGAATDPDWGRGALDSIFVASSNPCRLTKPAELREARQPG